MRMGGPRNNKTRPSSQCQNEGSLPILVVSVLLEYNVTRQLSAVLATLLTAPMAKDNATLCRAEPDVRWQIATRVRADVDCDGKIDRVYLGHKPGKVYVGLLRAAGATEVLSFDVGGNAQGSLCGDRVTIAIESPTSERDPDMPVETAIGKTHSGCSDIVMSDGECDSFHLFWDSKAKRLAWWRR
jgi:hypothetical protein